MLLGRAGSCSWAIFLSVFPSLDLPGSLHEGHSPLPCSCKQWSCLAMGLPILFTMTLTLLVFVQSDLSLFSYWSSTSVDMLSAEQCASHVLIHDSWLRSPRRSTRTVPSPHPAHSTRECLLLTPLKGNENSFCSNDFAHYLQACKGEFTKQCPKWHPRASRRSWLIEFRPYVGAAPPRTAASEAWG